ncbi:putative ribonuclease activity regulator protein [Actinacidiphila reveromycinica]|uniref:4-hydroxy-4-methyl-2-oxoglutarate aldolase n=1 Tax=Actinacidiphila reveromycinica TaxID=659352 RepID=A0A7U3UMY0_9ACTN|nr:ribonuclease E activity regulator RraA [Streptomyces sp. SN-593]BBA95528.1 putative ribonuclease activity regulator protein [Streptomyces sp. SN-593]
MPADPTSWSTADLCDAHEGTIGACTGQFTLYGGHRAFRGTVATVRCEDDNVLARQAMSEPGAGRVLVVDGGGSLRCALMGDQMAEVALANGWAGVVVNGAVRDTALLRRLPLGVAALGSNPLRSGKQGTGRRDGEVSFGGVTFRPGATVYVDEDGVVVLP